MTPQKLAKLDRRAAELGRDRSGYIRSLIEEDLNAPRHAQAHVFASEDLVGCIATGIKVGDNLTIRSLIHQRLRARHEKNR